MSAISLLDGLVDAHCRIFLGFIDLMKMLHEVTDKKVAIVYENSLGMLMQIHGIYL